MMTVKIHRLQAPGAHTRAAYAQPRRAYTTPRGSLRPQRSDNAPTASTPTTLRPLMRPKAVAAVAGEKPRSMAKGTKCVDTSAMLKPHTKYPPQSCHMGVERKASRQ